MADAKRCGCAKGAAKGQVESDPNKPKDIETETMVTPNDFGRIRNPEDGVTEQDVEESTVMINPDVESMESRG